MEDFHRQTGDNFPTFFEAFVLLSPRKVRITCRTALNMEEVCHLGLTFRDVRLTFNPVRTAKWANITRLSYGILNKAIADALKPYGKVIQNKIYSFHGVYVGVRQVLMDLSKPIPSRLTIAAHSCNCFYVGQVQTCFSCHQTGHMTKHCPNHARTTGNIINADGPLTGVNRPSTCAVPEERIGSHGTGNLVRYTTDESHTRFPKLTDGPHSSITAINADSHSLDASSTNNNLGNQQLNNSVTHSDVPNAVVRGIKMFVTSIKLYSHKDSDNSEDEDKFVDVLEELPLQEGGGGEQPVTIVLGKRTRELDDRDVSDISEKRVDRNPSSDGSHDANGVAIPLERTTSVQRKVRTRKSQRPSKVDDSSPLPSAPPADDSVHIASEILGTPFIEAYEGGDDEDGGGKDNEYPNIPENGSEFSTAQENDLRTTPSTQIPPNLPRKENRDSESQSPIDT
ncbi:zinc finger CCHC domain-containing 3-like [Paramuricea clavata]|uniref:Zinc finger CCHC domain-containing 3-like n=1 Tax=Paramuricea clavata TaxID=317549 RepID=A0A7D9DVI3_PARCT|nr:zinc finger CCHC domain-containing 3-like [Paramuricea clavata]